MSAPYNLHIDRTTIPGRVLLRAASSLNNYGMGPLEIRLQPKSQRAQRRPWHLGGLSDVYPYDYPKQWIDVTGLRGDFAYVQIAEPENLLLESHPNNDVSETYVMLPSGRVLGHRVDVAAP